MIAGTIVRKISYPKLAKFAADKLVAGESTKRLAHVLAETLRQRGETRRWETLLRDIAVALEVDHGILSAEITSAHRLSDDNLKRLSDQLRRQTKARTVQLTQRIDESLIGGFTIQTPRSTMDNSIAHKLQELQRI